REGGPDQGGRLPDDRGDRPGVSVGLGGGRAAGGRGGRGGPAEPVVGVNGAEDDGLRALGREGLAGLVPGGGGGGGGRGWWLGGGGGRASWARGTRWTHAPGALSVGPVGALVADEAGVAGRPGVGQPGLAHSVRENVEAVETVSLRTDADLDGFVKRLLRLFE